MRGMAGRARVFLLLLVALVLAGAYGYRDYAAFRDVPLNLAAGVEPLDVPRGMSLSRIVGELRRRNATAAPTLYWRALAWQLDASRRLV